MQLRKCAILIAALGLSAPVLAQSNISGRAATGANIGATSTNETGGTSRAGVQAQGSGSADLDADRPGTYNRAMEQDRANQRRSERAVSRPRGTAGADPHIGASGTNETGGNSRAGVKAQGSGSGNADMGAHRGRMRERNAAGNADATVSGGTGSTRSPGASGAAAGANAGAGVGVGVGGKGLGVDTNLGIGAGATTR